MIMKTVRIYKKCKLLKQFTCKLCDMSRGVINFFDVTPVTFGKKNININFCGDFYYEIDQRKRECIVTTQYPDIDIYITW